MTLFLLIVFIFFLVIGAPIGICFGLSSLFGIEALHLSNLIAMSQRFFEGINSFALLAVPLFTFAGLLMGAGGIGKRLIDFSYSIVGHITGGLAHVNVVTSMIFAGISGSAAADTAYESALIMKPMVAKKYSKEFTVAVTAISSTIGIIIPPSIPMVIIAGILGISTGKLFLGGIIPGILCGIAQIIVSYYMAKKEKVPKEEGKFELMGVWRAFKKSFLALLMPPVIMASIISGIVSATEVALIAVVYSLIVGGLVYKELNWQSLKEALVGTVKTTSKIFIIIGSAALFGKLLTIVGFDKILANSILSISTNQTIVLILILFILLILGMFMETISIIVLFMPILYPIVLQVGIDPIVMSVLAIIVLGIGLVTPPEGMCLFIACDFLKVKITSAMGALIPFIIGMLIVVALLIVFPQLILWPAGFIG
ncbi:MAG: TRAP transporter large permease [Treponema sp.]|jgi:tripartite ATP-independent transporter DctM subunit|nr:TRAP transporter large permease [Treponema sp.]